MDYQAFTDTFTVPCCVMEVVKNPDGTCGKVTIHRSNAIYKEVMGPAYYDDMPYEELVPKDNKFEDFCFRAAHENRRMHAYVETRGLNTWTDQQLLPLEKQDEMTGRCLFLFEFTREAGTDRMAEVSRETAQAVIRCCISLVRDENLKKSLDRVTSDICDIADALSCRILLIDHKKKKTKTLSCCSVDEKGKRFSGYMNEVSYEIVSTWEPMIGVSNDVILKNDRDMDEMAERNPEWVNDMRAHGVKSLVLIPLRRGKTVIGYLYAINYNVARTVEVKELIELLSFFLGMEISNHQLREEFEYRNNHDILTGVKSRAAMKRKMKEIDKQKPHQPFGLVNMDVNGLKTVNDSLGHDCGDRLILDSVEVMKECFGADSIYRVGGDEFLALVTDCTKEEFEEKVRRFRELKTDVTNASISAGCSWADETTDMQEAIRNADQVMYTDKKNYYRTHPDRRRS